MNLTDTEERMRDGESGEAVRFSMELLTKVGEAYGAETLAEVQSVHTNACYPELLASVELMERFADSGGQFKVAATVNPSHVPCNFNKCCDCTENPEYLGKARRIVDAIERMGVIPTYSCIPYFLGNAPRVGQDIAWTESSAICYANSVLGARTNRLTMGLDIAAALTGRIPRFGLHLDENRRANALVKMEFKPKNLTDYGTVGYIVGKHFGDKIPVIDGLPVSTTPNELKILGAAAASRGSVGMFHAVGLTPEAPTLDIACHGQRPSLEMKIGEKEVAEALSDINTAKSADFDAVLIGCPHATIEEVRELATLLSGKRIKPRLKFWIFTASYVVHLARHRGYASSIEEAGAQFIVGDCINFFDSKTWGWKNVMTNSAKFANILPSEPTWMDVIYNDVESCVKAAVL